MSLVSEVKKLLPEVRKFAVAVAGLAAEAVNAGLFTGTAAKIAALVIAAATAAGVYVIPNGAKAAAPAPTPPAAK